LQKGAEVGKFLFRFIEFTLNYIASKRECLSSLAGGGSLVLLATLVLGDFEDTRLGIILTVGGALMSIILARGGSK